MFKRMLWLLFLLPASAGWDEIRSPHFTVLTNDGVRSGREVAYYFEQVDHVFENIFPGIQNEPNRDLLIIAVSGKNGVNELIEEVGIGKTKNLAGVFIPGRYRHTIVVSLDALREGRQTIIHEYTHMIVNGNFILPVWMNEGLACFFMQMEFHSDRVNIGKANDDSIVLNREPMLPLAQLVEVDRSSPLYNERNLASVFYAQSWLLTHYALMSEDSRDKKRFSQLMSLSNQGVAPQEALVKVFGDLKALEKTLRDYLRKNRFPYYSIKTELKLHREKYPTTSLSPEQALSYKEVIRAGVKQGAIDENTIAQLLNHQDEPGIALNLALILAEANKPDEATQLIKRHQQVLEKDWLATYLRSLEPQLQPQQKRQLLEQALTQKANFAPAAYDLAWLLKENEPEVALTYALRATKAQPDFMPYRILHGNLLLHLNHIEESKALAAQALLYADDEEEAAIKDQWAAKIGQPGNKAITLTYNPFDRTSHMILREDTGYRRRRLYQTPLLTAVWTLAAKEELAKLIAAGKEERSMFGESALHLAAELGEDELTDQLLAAGYDPNAVDLDGWSPLLVALAEDNPSQAQKLIAAGAQGEAANEQGQTPLMWACYRGRTELVKSLLTKGARRDALDKQGHNAYDYLDGAAHKDLQKLLRDLKFSASAAGPLDEGARRELVRARSLAMRIVYSEKTGTDAEFNPDGNLQEDRPFTSSNKELNDLYRKATDATMDNEHEKSLRLLDKIIATEEGYEPAHDLRVHVLSVLGDKAEALAAVDRYAKVAGNRQNLGERYFQVGKLLMGGELTGELGRSAERCFKTALTLTAGKTPMIHYYLGDLYFQFGADPQALAAFKAYLATDDRSNWRSIAEDNVKALERELAKKKK